MLTQLEGSGGFSIAHRLTHRLANSQSLCDWGEPGGGSHIPELDFQTNGLHSPRLMTWGLFMENQRFDFNEGKDKLFLLFLYI